MDPSGTRTCPRIRGLRPLIRGRVGVSLCPGSGTYLRGHGYDEVPVGTSGRRTKNSLGRLRSGGRVPPSELLCEKVVEEEEGEECEVYEGTMEGPSGGSSRWTWVWRRYQRRTTLRYRGRVTTRTTTSHPSPILPLPPFGSPASPRGDQHVLLYPTGPSVITSTSPPT